MNSADSEAIPFPMTSPLFPNSNPHGIAVNPTNQALLDALPQLPPSQVDFMGGNAPGLSGDLP